MANEDQLQVFKQGARTWNKWREANPEVKINLTGADLSRAILSLDERNSIGLFRANLREADRRGAILREADIRGVDLSGANLRDVVARGADLSGALLTKADLSEADLSRVQFYRADLSEANLTNALLTEANLNGACLTGAVFSKALLNETVFGNNDLSRVNGLNECFHYGPSTIDTRTLRKSWLLPLKFLRGVGLSDWEITITQLHNPC